MARHRLPLPALLAAALVWAASAQAFDTQAASAYVLDHTTGTVLLQKDATRPIPPASMSKLMTLNMLFEALDDGRVSLETEFSVSARASAMGGSTMFLREGERVAVKDLIPGIVVNSGNDACVVVAEGLAGTEEGFARLMNDRATALGMHNSTFANASGWPHPNQRMSVEDLAFLSSRLIREFPEYYGYFAQEEFLFDGRAPANKNNRNPLLGVGIGVDGLKTGHTQEAGYGLAASARQGDRRVVFVISGLPDAQSRAQEGERIVNWAFRQFSKKKLADAGRELARAPVWMGEKRQVTLVTDGVVEVLVPSTVRGELQAEVRFNGPIEAPIDKGQKLGELVISLPDLDDVHVPLVASEAIAKGGFTTRLRTAAQALYARYVVPALTGG
ncbi:D-alanyl-D-alanine carboxypeptidase [Maritimibacter sp. 55A14]|uniref:D-alanyl-D-alanine carboxypeptidase family protein n=1 Tax=Maritimibacter sp. 55A14 TaxID=2174844 RepID=UPI000D610E65|nr:D-alanyl-D-alanine carboxypeptidase family protein [Maritimibacter sp. 55A14]PWE30552.1 D-alanyl-D-alanine carboxypeptidase [Maritimibacter sp. 55A14]